MARPTPLSQGTTHPSASPKGALKKQRRSRSSGGMSSTPGAQEANHSGIVFNKGHGQHILKNPLVLNAIVEKAAVKPTDVILEIGPGTGNLTEKLLQAAKKVIAFEIDPRMVAELRKRFQNTPLGKKLEVVQGNCLKFDFPYFDKCVANTPYAISSALIFKLLDSPQSFKCAVLMFQREFALRLVAKAGDPLYCRLGVNCQLLSKCAHVMKISKNSFNPPPKVESSVVRIDPRHPLPDVNLAEWDGMIKLLFNRKNKKVSGIFSTKAVQAQLYKTYVTYCEMKEEKALVEDEFRALVQEVCHDQSVKDQRARLMTQEDFMTLLARFHEKGVHFT